jgi:hypothetical protein
MIQIIEFSKDQMCNLNGIVIASAKDQNPPTNEAKALHSMGKLTRSAMWVSENLKLLSKQSHLAADGISAHKRAII